MEDEGGGRAAAGHLYLVDTLAGDPEVLQAEAEAYYEKLLKKSSSTPDVFSVPGGEEVKLEDSCVCFVPLYRNNPTCKLLLLTDPKDKETVLAVYLNQCWWPLEDVVKTADPSRDGLILLAYKAWWHHIFALMALLFALMTSMILFLHIPPFPCAVGCPCLPQQAHGPLKFYDAGATQVQTLGERIVLFVLNYIIFGMLEGSSANDAFFLPHSATECAKILWSNGEAVAFYSVKMKGSLCDGMTSQCYLLPVLDTIFVQRKYRRGGLGLKMLNDFCQSFMAEDALGISCPISAAMYQVCQKFLQTYPEEQKRLWEVEAPGDWSQRVNIWLKIQMESSPSGKAEAGIQTNKCRKSDVDQMSKIRDCNMVAHGEFQGFHVQWLSELNCDLSLPVQDLECDTFTFQGIEYVPGVGKAAGDATEEKDDTAATRTLNSQGPEQEDLEQGAGNTQQCKGFRKRAGPGGLVGDKATKQFRIAP